MTTLTTPEMIQEMSVNIVKDFVTNKIPLSDGIAKTASEMELNPEQIKRVVETCNTVTYLSLQKEASDRTFEFPVADYNAVISKIALPETKNASVVEKEFKDATTQPEVEKQAEYQPDLQTVQAWTRAEYIRNKSMLEKLAMESEDLAEKLQKAGLKLRQDTYCLEKLAEVTDEKTFYKLATLVRPLIVDASGKLQLIDRIFKEAELSDARNLVSLYKQATEIVEEVKHRKELEKRAVVGAIAGAMGKALGGLVGGTSVLGTKAIVGAIKGTSKSKLVSPLDIGATAITRPASETDIWSNLQSRNKRF